MTLLSSSWRKLRWMISYWISRAGITVGRHLPTRFCYMLAIPIADLAFLVLSRHRRNLIENLTRVVGAEEAPAAARGAFRNFARYVIDLYQLPSRGQKALHDRIEFDDWDRLEEALNHPRGTVGVTLHLGQVELGAAGLTTYGHKVNAIAETLDYAPMNDFIQGLRRRMGLNIIPANKAAPGVLRCLNRGEVLALMFDAVEPGQGIQVPFFGAQAEMSSAPARIALRTGARVLPVVVGRSQHDPMVLTPLIDADLSFESTGDEEADVYALTAAIAASFERFIRRFPDQWFAFRSVWTKAEATGKRVSRTELWKHWSLTTAVKIGGKMPRPLAYAAARLAGDLAFYLRKPTRQHVEENMRHVMPSAPPEVISTAAKEAFRNVARYYTDLIRLPQTDPKRLMAKEVTIDGLDKVTNPMHEGRGVIICTAHFGNPEMGIQVGAILGLNILALAEPLQPPAFAALMQKIRSGFGPRYLDVGFGAVAQVMRHLRSGGALAITCDRDIQGTGVPIPFFGVPAALPLGAVEFATRTNSLLVPAYCRRTPRGFHIVFEEPLELISTGRPREDVIENTRRLLGRAESWIRSDPGQWMVLDRVWKPFTKRQTRAATSDGRAALRDESSLVSAASQSASLEAASLQTDDNG